MCNNLTFCGLLKARTFELALPLGRGVFPPRGDGEAEGGKPKALNRHGLRGRRKETNRAQRGKGEANRQGVTGAPVSSPCRA